MISLNQWNLTTQEVQLNKEELNEEIKFKNYNNTRLAIQFIPYNMDITLNKT